MSYEVRLRHVAQKGLDQLPEPDYGNVAGTIHGLEENPRPPGVKKLADSSLWRVRVGRYRVIYAIDDGKRLVTVVRVAKREENTYRGL
ncbi:MAG: type II toxin-antitoxin system RelE/ParE family toxin [Chloroflexi bacterium]|nr:type II toxin-antitoxin system RelE/ParE family toxin [Chloroflexota bacterium]